MLIGGGSGGHIYPLIVLAQELENLSYQEGIDLELMAISDNEMWRDDFSGIDIKFKKILAPKLRRFEGDINFLDILKIPIAFFQSLWYIFLFMPDLVLAKGGYVSVIPSIVSFIYFIPIFIHESDTIPGLVNRFIGKFAKIIFISFEVSRNYFKNNKKIILSGNPIRSELLSGDKNEALDFFKFSPEKKTVLVLGGSQGSKIINELIINSLVKLTKNYQVIHQAGIKNFDYVLKETKKIELENLESYGKNIEKNYRLFSFLSKDELKNAYALADIIISRAGANLVWEISSVGKPVILIPIRYSTNNHQRSNAKELEKFGAVILEEENLTTNLLLNQIEHLLNPINYQRISESIKKFSNPDSAKIIAQEIFRYANRK